MYLWGKIHFMKQLSFADIEVASHRKPSRISLKLDKIDAIVSWDKVLEVVKVVDRTDKKIGGCPHKAILSKIKMLFLQHLYNLSDPELEDQVNDRLSFQHFAGIDFSSTVPDYTTIWRFKERLIQEGLIDKLFELIVEFIDNKGLIIKKGTLIDATIIESGTRPLSKDKRAELAEKPSSQLDTDAHSTVKRGKKYFGYKGHTGVDMGSKLIRKRNFTSAQPHDSQLMDGLLSGDECAIFADSAYSNKADKRRARASGIYYGVLDKGTRRRKLSTSQKKRNKQKSSIRSAVEHPFAYMKVKLCYTRAVAKTKARNALRFDFNCILYNIFRANFLLSR
jgi:IS5 family transposase